MKRYICLGIVIAILGGCGARNSGPSKMLPPEFNDIEFGMSLQELQKVRPFVLAGSISGTAKETISEESEPSVCVHFKAQKVEVVYGFTTNKLVKLTLRFTGSSASIIGNLATKVLGEPEVFKGRVQTSYSWLSPESKTVMIQKNRHSNVFSISINALTESDRDALRPAPSVQNACAHIHDLFTSEFSEKEAPGWLQPDFFLPLCVGPISEDPAFDGTFRKCAMKSRTTSELDRCGHLNISSIVRASAPPRASKDFDPDRYSAGLSEIANSQYRHQWIKLEHIEEYVAGDDGDFGPCFYSKDVCSAIGSINTVSSDMRVRAAIANMKEYFVEMGCYEVIAAAFKDQAGHLSKIMASSCKHRELGISGNPASVEPRAVVWALVLDLDAGKNGFIDSAHHKNTILAIIEAGREKQVR